MIRKKGHQTLRDELEKLKKDVEKNENKGKRRVWIKLTFSLLFLTAGYFLGFLIYAFYGVLGVELIQCLLARRRFYKNRGQHKAQKQMEIQIRTASEMILIGYLLLAGFAISVYGILCYILHLPIGAFILTDWLHYSIMLFLVFEVIVMQFYRKIERKV